MKKKNIFRGISFNLVAVISAAMFILCAAVSTVGYYRFTDIAKKQYGAGAIATANTATALVNADKIEEYLADGGAGEDYATSLRYLTVLCEKQNVTIVYIIKVDTSDYKSFVSVFNVPSSTSGFTPWDIGYERSATNDEYVSAYRFLYESERSEAEKGVSITRDRGLTDVAAHITSMVPLYRSDGTVSAIVCVQSPMSELIVARRNYMNLVAAVTLGITVILIIGAALFARAQIVRPLLAVVNEAERFATTTMPADVPFDKKISRIAEIKDLAFSINKMEADTVSYMDRLLAAANEKQRIGTELSIATLIQESMIPNEFPPFPERGEFELYATMRPAKEVGGDFYNFFLIDDDHLAFVIADVSGKGVPAALFMMVTMILVTELSHVDSSPAAVLEALNTRICANNRADMFVTVWLGVLELSTGVLTYANAGHDDPAIATDGGEFKLTKDKHGLVVGAFPQAKYKEFRIQLKAGDRIFLYTDGIPEATDEDQQLFKTERMLAALNSIEDDSPQALIDGVWRSVTEFVKEAPQFDDATMLALKYNGNVKNDDSLTLPASEESLETAQGFLERFLDNKGADMKSKNQFALILEEVFVNVVKYAYSSGEGTVSLTLDEDDGAVTITVKDRGTPYDPLSREDPDVTKSAEDRPIGGLGIFVVKKLCDKVEYRFENGENILIMEKKVGKAK